MQPEAIAVVSCWLKRQEGGNACWSQTTACECFCIAGALFVFVRVLNCYSTVRVLCISRGVKPALLFICTATLYQPASLPDTTSSFHFCYRPLQPRRCRLRLLLLSARAVTVVLLSTPCRTVPCLSCTYCMYLGFALHLSDRSAQTFFVYTSNSDGYQEANSPAVYHTRSR